MAQYVVRITATITKNIEVEASNQDDAIELAHELFSVLNDENQERYEQETDFCEIVSYLE